MGMFLLDRGDVVVVVVLVLVPGGWGPRTASTVRKAGLLNLPGRWVKTCAERRGSGWSDLNSLELRACAVACPVCWADRGCFAAVLFCCCEHFCAVLFVDVCVF